MKHQFTGDLTVNGTSITVNSTTTSVADSLMEFANANTSSDTLDIGFCKYNDGLSDGGETMNIQDYSEMQVIQHGNYLTD